MLVVTCVCSRYGLGQKVAANSPLGAGDEQLFPNCVKEGLPTIRPEYCRPEGARQDRVELYGLAIQKFDQLRNDLMRRFFHEPVAGIANDHAFDIRGNEPALLNEKIAGGFFTC
jgi:hypothetical protein